MVWFRNRKRSVKIKELHPDEILLDVHNLPSFNKQQFEGVIERPIAKKSTNVFYFLVLLCSFYFLYTLFKIQIFEHDSYKLKSEQNSLNHIPVFADRGVIYDRNGIELVTNMLSQDKELVRRAYTKEHGFSNVLGYVSYPAKDDKGFYWQDKVVGKDGIEKEFDEYLSGQNGKQLVETDVTGKVVSGGIVNPPKNGQNITLSIDARIQKALFLGIKDLAERSGYVGGAGAVMDIETGELYALVTYPEYDANVLSEGKDITVISHYLKSDKKPLLNRVLDGVYTPGSIVKPFLALAALQEGVITPNKIIVSTGKLEIPNPYNPKLKSIFRDNKAHGPVDMKKAIAVSSNVYFYEIGGGFGAQRGLGIANIEKYTRMFGIGEKTGIDLGGEREGNIPSVEWKAKRFPGDPWRVGDTYNTSIGQYGFQVTPIQMVRAIGGIASRGTLVTPTIVANHIGETISLPISKDLYTPVHDGMRQGVLEGTTQALQNSTVHVAAKSGTAQIKNNTRVNSWVVGFFPYESPRFSFVVLMENGPLVSSGAVHAFRPVLDVFSSTPALLSR